MTTATRIIKRHRAARALARKLDAASDAMEVYLDACNACNDGTGAEREDDGRRRLKNDMREFAHWMAIKYPEVE